NLSPLRVDRQLPQLSRQNEDWWPMGPVQISEDIPPHLGRALIPNHRFPIGLCIPVPSQTPRESCQHVTQAALSGRNGHLQALGIQYTCDAPTTRTLY